MQLPDYIYLILLEYCNKKNFLIIFGILKLKVSDNFWKKKIIKFFGSKALPTETNVKYVTLFKNLNSGFYCNYCFSKNDFKNFDTEYGFLCEECLNELTDVGAIDCTIS